MARILLMEYDVHKPHYTSSNIECLIIQYWGWKACFNRCFPCCRHLSCTLTLLPSRGSGNETWMVQDSVIPLMTSSIYTVFIYISYHLICTTIHFTTGCLCPRTYDTD